MLDPVIGRGGRVVGVGPDGVIDLGALAAALDPDVVLVSVMLANNEVGTVQPLAAVAEVVRLGAPGRAAHRCGAGPQLARCRLAGRSGRPRVGQRRRFGGRRASALVVRDGVDLQARQIGAARSGSAAAAPRTSPASWPWPPPPACVADRPATVARVGALRDRLADGLLATVPDLVETGLIETGRRDGPGEGARRSHRRHRHVCISGVESEALLFLLEEQEVYASAASSCASGAMEPSHVLAAMGIDRRLAFGSLRLSLGWSSTDADVDLALAVIPAAIDRLRQFAAPTPA